MGEGAIYSPRPLQLQQTGIERRCTWWGLQARPVQQLQGNSIRVGVGKGEERQHWREGESPLRRSWCLLPSPATRAPLAGAGEVLRDAQDGASLLGSQTSLVVLLLLLLQAFPSPPLSRIPLPPRKAQHCSGEHAWSWCLDGWGGLQAREGIPALSWSVPLQGSTSHSSSSSLSTELTAAQPPTCSLLLCVCVSVCPRVCEGVRAQRDARAPAGSRRVSSPGFSVFLSRPRAPCPRAPSQLWS